MISFFEQIADKLHRFSQRECESFWCIRLDANGSVSTKISLSALKKRFSENLPFSPEFSLFLRVRWMRMICGAKATVLHFSGRNWKRPETQKSREISDFTAFFDGGPGGIRTLDLSDANRTLSQLSYRPLCRFWGRSLGPRYVALALPAELQAHILPLFLSGRIYYSTGKRKKQEIFSGNVIFLPGHGGGGGADA